MAATVTIRLDDDMRDRLSEAAESRGTTVSNYIRDALELHLRVEQPDSADDVAADGATTVSMTPYQRKVLQMLHRITLATQGDLDWSGYDRESELQMLKVLEGGFTGEYSREFSDVLEPMNQAECELVWDILDMFRVIGQSIRGLGKDGWKQTGVEDAEFHGTFSGFDLNDSTEARLLDYASYLISTDRWTEQKDAFSRENDSGNSHTQMLPTYRSMLRAFKPLWRKTVRGGRSPHHLSVDDLKQILSAAPGAKLAG